MKKAFSLFLTIVIVTLCVNSCSSGKGGFYEEGSTGSANGYPSLEDKYESDVGDKVTDTALTTNRKIIKTVNETLQTEDFIALIKEINSLVSSLGGYISEANYGGENYYNKETLRFASLTVRIPAEMLSDFTGGLEGKAVVSNYTETMNDVTGVYIDVESRISVLESEQTALLDMLGKSPDINTMLSIRQRLNEVQSDLASLNAQKKDYDSGITYSTVYLKINEVRHAKSANPGFFEEIGNVFMESVYNVGDFFRGLAVFVIGGFLYILIFAVIIIVVSLLSVKLIRKYKNKKSREMQENGNTEEGNNT